MSRVVSMRLRDEQMQRLQRLARRLGRTPSETAAILVDEALRVSEFAFIEFRNSAVGRQPYVRGTGMTVWEIIMVARSHEGDAAKTAASLEVPLVRIQAAFNYAEAFPEEIKEALEDNHKSFEELKRMLPNIEIFEVGPLDDEAPSEQPMSHDPESTHEAPAR